MIPFPPLPPPLFFFHVLNVLITAITKDSCCPLLFHAWYLDDSAHAGPRSSLCKDLTLIQERGPPLGLYINTSAFGSQLQHHLASAIQLFNSSVQPSEAINSEALLLTVVTQKSLSFKLDDHHFKVLLDVSSIADKAHLLSPSEGLHLDPSQFHVAIKWLKFLMVLAAHCALRLFLTH